MESNLEVYLDPTKVQTRVTLRAIRRVGATQEATKISLEVKNRKVPLLGTRNLREAHSF
tara:strand:+ start:793 stop:969 length:177 start_codon:yes stop_codon:yes gene_type:complete